MRKSGELRSWQSLNAYERNYCTIEKTRHAVERLAALPAGSPFSVTLPQSCLITSLLYSYINIRNAFLVCLETRPKISLHSLQLRSTSQFSWHAFGECRARSRCLLYTPYIKIRLSCFLLCRATRQDSTSCKTIGKTATRRQLLLHPNLRPLYPALSNWTTYLIHALSPKIETSHRRISLLSRGFRSRSRWWPASSWQG